MVKVGELMRKVCREIAGELPALVIDSHVTCTPEDPREPGSRLPKKHSFYDSFRAINNS